MIFVVLILVLGIMGVLLVAAAVRDTARGLASKSWPQARGVIRESSIKVDVSEGCSSYSAKVTYEYSVDGIPYLGKRFQYGQISIPSRSAVAEAICPFPVGSQVTVYFRPGHPEDAVLVPGLSWGILVAFGLGIAFAGGGIAWFSKVY